MKKMKLVNHNDPSHSWYAVKRSLIKELGLETDISPYSYQKGETVYLEEDSDAGKFFNAYAKKVAGVEPRANGWENWQALRAELFDSVSSYKEKSPVRNYAMYNPLRVEKFEVGMKFMLYSNMYEVVSAGPLVYVKNMEGKTYKLSNKQKDEAYKIA